MQREFAPGTYNVVAPETIGVGDYYHGLAAQQGVTISLKSDGNIQPSRAITAEKLWQLHVLDNWRRWDGTPIISKYYDFYPQ